MTDSTRARDLDAEVFSVAAQPGPRPFESPDGRNLVIALKPPQLSLDAHGHWNARILGIPMVLARPPRGAVPAGPFTLILSSPRMELRAGRLCLWCYACKCPEPLLSMGLRTMPGGAIRNQPRCTAGRHARATR